MPVSLITSVIKRQCYGKYSAFSFFTFYRDGSRMTLYDLIGNKKTNAKARIGLFTFSFHPVKPFKYPVLIFFINANSMIFYFYNSMFFISIYIHFNVICIGRIFDCIGEEVEQHL